jgi:protein SCO1/2
LRGKVLSKDRAANEITVKHDEIKGYMPAMTMPYKVKDPAVVQELQPGDLIVADLTVTDRGSWLEDVRVIDEGGRKTAKPAAPSHILKTGERVPDFALLNQDGKTIHLKDFSGKAVLVTFIYTRCPMPDFCPRLSSQFAKVHEDLAKTPDDYNRTHLLTISFDPAYDTAPVLRRYGLAYLDNHPDGFSHWDFVTSDAANMRKFADAFGLQYFEEDNQIAHSMVIALIGPDGEVANYWANRWTAPELEEALRQALRAAPAGKKR